MSELVKKQIEMDDEIDSLKVKRLKSEETSASNETSIKKFMDWCQSVEIFIDYEKVKLTSTDTSHNYGMIAIKQIEANEILARIPKKALLQPATTQIADLIRKNSKELESDSNWSKLAVALMYEANISDSKWATYLQMFPNYEDFDLPMFWPKDELSDLLKHTCVPQNISIDLEKMKTEYEKIILPFLQKYKEKFNEKFFDYEYYKKTIGFIMAYSFRDPNEDPEDPKSIGPLMVPVGDILNHIAKNNAHIRFEKNELVISSTKPIEKGEEVYNTYGEHSNTDLLHMYGFVEEHPSNIYDTVEIPTRCLISSMITQNREKKEIVDRKIEILKEIELIDEDVSLIIGMDGIVNEEECLHMLQIYSMSKDELEEFVQNDCELLEDEEWDNFSLRNENLNKLPIDWKEVLNDCVSLHMENLKYSFIELNSKDFGEEKGKRRLSIAKTIIKGHLEILKTFSESLLIKS